MILSDNETKVDLLNNEAIATTIVQLLRHRPDQPVTIGVHGDWGAGKSSVLEMVEAGLSNHKDVLSLKFNGWRFQGFEDAKIALIEDIVSGLLKRRPLLTKASSAVKNILRRIDWLKVAKKAGGLAFTAMTGIPTFEQIQAVIGGLEGILADPSKLLGKEHLEGALDSLKSMLKEEGETKSVPEEIGEFRKAFDELLKEAGIEQLVVLIDDLDRCLPDTAIETLEAVRLFLFSTRTAFVVAADEAMIEYAVRKHFPDLPDTTGPRDYARNYLEKLIQVPFRIPALGETETRSYVTLLLVGAELGEDVPEFRKLIGVARQRLKQPWKSNALDAATLKVALGDKTQQAETALTLSDQIGPILANGTQGNPRQIKRFLNALRLRHQTAVARGFGDDVKIPVLAKLMLAERFLPRFFDQIATTAAADANGSCGDLAVLEAAAASSESATSRRPTKAKPAAENEPRKLEISATLESVALAEWLSSKPILEWASIQPELAGVDLRPYLFVAKDRKNYFGAASALGHLAAVVERLMGPKLSVQAHATDLKKLSSVEAAEVFEALRGRIVGGDEFDTQPAGVDGLMVLVRTHPTLQANLIDLLESLPRDRLGSWAVKGWSGIIKDAEAQTRLDRLLATWATGNNALLKAAASAVLKTQKGTG